jgi:hypothetical protein
MIVSVYKPYTILQGGQSAISFSRAHALLAGKSTTLFTSDQLLKNNDAAAILSLILRNAST